MCGWGAQQWGLPVRGTQNRDSPPSILHPFFPSTASPFQPGHGLLLGPNEFEALQLSCPQARLMPSSALPGSCLHAKLAVLALYIAHLYLGACWWPRPPCSGASSFLQS